jgi:hypothetical protein
MSVLILARHNISFSSGEDDWIGCDGRVRSMKAFWSRAQKRAILLERLCNERYARCSLGVADGEASAVAFAKESLVPLIPHNGNTRECGIEDMLSPILADDKKASRSLRGIATDLAIEFVPSMDHEHLSLV